MDPNSPRVARTDRRRLRPVGALLIMLSLTLGMASCSSTSTSTSTSPSDVAATKGAAGDSCKAKDEVFSHTATTIEVLNQTDSPVVVQVPSKSWHCTSFATPRDPSMLNVEVAPRQSISKELRVIIPTIYPATLKQMSFTFRTPDPNGGGSNSIAFGSDSTLTARYATQNEMFGEVGWQARSGALTVEPFVDSELFSKHKDWNGSWTGSVTGTTVDGRRIQILWNGAKPYGTLTITLRTA